MKYGIPILYTEILIWHIFVRTHFKNFYRKDFLSIFVLCDLLRNSEQNGNKYMLNPKQYYKTHHTFVDKLNTDLCTVKTFYIFKLFLNFHKVLKTTNQPFNTKKIKLCENSNVIWVILFSKKLREKIASQKARTFLIELLQNSHLDVTTHNFLILNLH